MYIEGYKVRWKTAPTIEGLKEKLFHQAACFSYFKNGDFDRFFQAKFENKYDTFEARGEHSTEEWMKEFPPSTLAMSGIVAIEVDEKYYYVTLDLDILSYQWAFSILTLLRYPGEYYNICWNYWKVREAFPKLNKWQALHIAHQGTWNEEYQDIFGRSFYYNGGHSLFKSGQALSKVNSESTFNKLDTFSALNSKERVVTDIQTIWAGRGYKDYLNFDIPEWYKKAEHIDMEIV